MLGIRNSSGFASLGVDTSKVWCLSKFNRIIDQPTGNPGGQTVPVRVGMREP